MEGRAVKQDLTPNVWQLEFVDVPVKGWIIILHVHVLLYVPIDVVHLPTHHGASVHTDMMTTGVTMVIEG